MPPGPPPRTRYLHLVSLGLEAEGGTVVQPAARDVAVAGAMRR